MSVSFLPYYPHHVIALRFKTQIPYLSKIKTSYFILLIFQFWWGKKRQKESQNSPLGSFNFLKSLKVTAHTVPPFQSTEVPQLWDYVPKLQGHTQVLIAHSSRNTSWNKNAHISVTKNIQILCFLFLPLNIYMY